MNPQRAFIRKVVYVVAIGLLLIPLFLLARPTSTTRPGGKLSQLREAQGLSEAQLGEIDPTSEAMKLSTFGMRGVATAILWSKSMDCKKKKNWTSFAATLNQIIRLEPHFISVWKFQAWNIAYNVSVEFDDYRERYRWVIKGIEFLIQGISYNERNPILHADVGWDIAQKIGTADEKVQFRKLFREDDEFHTKYRTPSVQQRDNWLVGKSWYAKAEKLVSEGESIGKMGENIFYARRPMCQMNYAKTVESEGQFFGERAGEQWAKAHREWTEEFGAMPIRTTYRDDNDNIIKVVLNEFDGLTRELTRLTKEIESFQEGIRTELLYDRWQNMEQKDRNAWRYGASTEQIDPPADIVAMLDERVPDWRDPSVDLVRDLITNQQAAALETPHALRTSRDLDLVEQARRTIGEAAYRVVDAMEVRPEDIARRLSGTSRKKAFALVEKINKIARQRRIIAGYRNTINYENWKFRAEYEQLPETLEAHEYIFKGKEALADALLPEAKDAFRRGLAAWGKVLSREDCKRLADDRDTIEDLQEVIKSYVSLLNQRDELFPEDFPLADFYGKLAEEESATGISAAREADAYADRLRSDGEMEKAIEAYESSLSAWRDGMMEYPALALMINRKIGNEALDTIESYAAALAEAGRNVPIDFVLAEFVHLQLSHAPEATKAIDEFRLASARFGKSEYPAAQEHLEAALQQWRSLLDRHPSILVGSDPTIAGQISETIDLYRQVLELRGAEFPEDFLLQDFVESQNEQA